MMTEDSFNMDDEVDKELRMIIQKENELSKVTAPDNLRFDIISYHSFFTVL